MITALPTPPQRSDSANFAARADAFLTALPTFGVEANELASDVNSKQSLATSAANTATTQAEVATTAANTATTKANEASVSAGNALTYAQAAQASSGVPTPIANRVLSTDSSGNITWRDLGLDPATWQNLPTLRPSLLLDFANSKSIDPRITFVRASTATRTDEKGLIESVAANVPRIDFDPVSGACKGLLIEEQRTNLLTYSEQFDNDAWVKLRSNVTPNVITAPDGTLTADKLVEDTTASATHSVTRSALTVAKNVVSAFSIYVKAAERTKLRLRLNAFGGETVACDFSLSDGIVSTPVIVGTGSSIGAFMTPAGNGWFRCVLVGTPSSSAATGVDCDVYLVSGATAGYTGDGTSGIYIWGAQLEAGSFPTSYVPSSVTFTGRSSTGTYTGSDGLLKTAASGVARYSYNPSNLNVAPALLLEESRTNLLTYSEQFDNAVWSGATTTAVVPNAASAPDGTATADKLIPDTDYESHLRSQTYAGFTSGTTYTFSVFAKAAEMSVLQMYFGSEAFNSGLYINFNLSNGSIVSTGGGGTGSISSFGNGWYLCTLVATSTATAATFAALAPYTSGNPGRSAASTGDGTSGLYLWGAQLEVGTFPTSYIPTTTAQVTRAADTSTSAATTRTAEVPTMTGANFSGWYRQGEGTFVVEGDTNSRDYGTFLSANNGTSGNEIRLIAWNDGVLRVATNSGGVAGTNSNTPAIPSAPPRDGSRFVAAMAYKTAELAAAHNGVVVVSGGALASYVPPAVNRIHIGSTRSSFYMSGHIRRIAYYPKRLSNAELQALTTL